MGHAQVAGGHEHRRAGDNSQSRMRLQASQKSGEGNGGFMQVMG